MEPANQPTPPPTPASGGVRPSVGPLIALLLGRLLLGFLPPLLANPLRSAILVVGIALLQYRSRAYCGTREMVLAALACGAAAGTLVLDLNDPTSSMAIGMRVLTVAAGAAWAVLWLRRGRS